MQPKIVLDTIQWPRMVGELQGFVAKFQYSTFSDFFQEKKYFFRLS